MNNETRDKKIREGLETCPAGVHCYFIRLNSLWGAKCYRSRSDRDTAYERQTDCFNHGLAPETTETFEVDVDYYDDEDDTQVTHLWGYITEVIEPCVDMESDNFESDCDRFEADYEKDCWLIQEQIERKTGWRPDDPHGYNWGWNDGKLQLLDFM